MSAPATPQVEADRRLLHFKTYDDYLDSLTTVQDHCFLQSTTTSRTLAELGYRSSGETLTRDQFERRRAAVLTYLYPTYKPYEMASEGLRPSDPLQKELALRERPNRVGILALLPKRDNYLFLPANAEISCPDKLQKPHSIYHQNDFGKRAEFFFTLKAPFDETIIFLRHFTRAGFEISGYIDYAERLKNEDWKPFFKGLRKIYPRRDDLGYFHWRSGKTMSKDSLNYKVLVHPFKGLLFQNRFDRKVVSVDPVSAIGANSIRLRVASDLYEDAVLYDHVVRQRI